MRHVASFILWNIFHYCFSIIARRFESKFSFAQIEHHIQNNFRLSTKELLRLHIISDSIQQFQTHRHCHTNYQYTSSYSICPTSATWNDSLCSIESSECLCSLDENQSAHICEHYLTPLPY